MIDPGVIAIDAPCRWSLDGRAVGHASNDYGWMLQGEALCRELEASHPLLTGLQDSDPVCLETFPHAATWHLRGGHASGTQKRSQRRQLLVQAGINPAPLTNIDLIDAALCAYVADRLASGSPCRACGEADTGLIVVPQPPRAPAG